MNNIIKNVLVGIVVVVVGGAILIWGNNKYEEYKISRALEEAEMAQSRDSSIKSSLLSLVMKSWTLSGKNEPHSYKGFCEYISEKRPEDISGTDNLKYLKDMSDGNAYCKVTDDYSKYKVSARLSNGDYYCIDSEGNLGIVVSYFAEDYPSTCSW